MFHDAGGNRTVYTRRLPKAHRERSSYTLSKNAGTALLQQVARAIEPRDLQISIFHPGTVFTESLRNLGGNESSYDFDDGKFVLLTPSRIELKIPRGILTFHERGPSGALCCLGC
jgi:hypothetical protein